MSKPGFLMRLKQRLSARWASPLRLWLGADLQISSLGASQSTPIHEWIAQHQGTAFELIVPAALQHQLVCEPGLPLDDAASQQAYARQQFNYYFGSAAQHWSIAPWSSGGRRGAVALHGLDFVALREHARKNRINLRSAQPAWSAALAWLSTELPAWAKAEDTALAWVEGILLTWVRFKAGGCIDVRHVRLPTTSPEALDATLQTLRREMPLGSVAVLGYGLDAEPQQPLAGVQSFQGLADKAPRAAWFTPRPTSTARTWPQPDFIEQASPRSWLAWPLAATGVLMLGMAIWTATESRNSLVATQERLQLVAQRNAVPARAAPSIRKSETVITATPTDWRAAREAKLLLQQPWEATLADVERVGVDSNVHWLVLDVQAHSNTLQLEGLAADKATALRVAEHLASDPGWQDVMLKRLQLGEAGQQRFELGARLQPSAMRAPADMGAPR